MEKRFLIASRSFELAAQIHERLMEAFPEPLVDHALNSMDAERRVDRDRHDLIISEIDLPHDAEAILRGGQRLGYEFLKRLRDRDISVPFVLLGTSYDDRVRRHVQTHREADYITREDPDWDELLIKVCRKLITPNAVRDRVGLQLEIILHAAGKYGYRINLTNKPSQAVEGPLAIDETLINRLVRWARRIPSGPEWQPEFQDIGELLGEAIFRSNYEFAIKFHNYLGAVDNNRENVTIRFVVGEDVYPVLFEALKEVGERYWILDAPVYRSVPEFTDRYALFQDIITRRGPINCLIIQADVGKRVVKDPNVMLMSLANVAREVTALRTYLDEPENKERFHMGTVRVLDNISGTQAVHDALAENEWHIVHYAGHSYYDLTEKKGYVFFPGTENVIPVPAEEFAQWLNEAKARLLYLSSCHSSEEDFVFELANKLMPAVIGFRWDIEDDLAAEYTRVFYEQLFKKMSLEKAFFEARRKMHSSHTAKRIWASPVLVIQAKKE
jgi:hypothetical protein